MPVSSAQHYPVTTARKSLLPPSSSTYTSKTGLYSTGGYYSHSRPSVLSSYRSSAGDDSTTASSSRFGVSNKYSASSTLLSSSSRVNIDKDRKPPIGLRYRSESLTRDKTLDLLSSKSDYSSTNSIKRQSSSSLARSVATSGADLYEKYNPAKYKPNCELSRSRSLSESTANKLVDSINSSSRSASRASSKDRGNSYSSTAKDYLNNATSTTSTLSKVNANANASFCTLSATFLNKPCLNANSNTNNNNNALNGIVVVSTVTNNNNFNNKRSFFTATSIGASHLTNDSIQTNTSISSSCQCKPLKVTTITFDTDANRSTTITSNGIYSNNSNNSNNNSSSSSSSISSSNSNSNSNSNKNSNSNNSNNNNSINNNNSNISNNNRTAVKNDSAIASIRYNSPSYVASNRLSGPKPLLASYKKSDFLKCEYDLARSQVVKSTSSSNSTTSNNLSSKNETNNNGTSLTSDQTLNKLPIFDQTIGRGKIGSTYLDRKLESGNHDLNQFNQSRITSIAIPTTTVTATATTATTTTGAVAAAATGIISGTANMNCIQKSSELFDDIKFIDCDESDRKISPTMTKFSSAREILKEFSEQSLTLPSAISKRTTDVNTNKYNTLTNNMKAFDQINIQITNGTAKRASSEDLMSSTSSSASTLSVSASSISSINQDVIQQKAKTNVLVKIDSQKVDGTDDNNIRSSENSSRLWDRDTKAISTPTRTLSDSDALKKSFAASSISDKTDNSDGLCGLRNIGNTCFMNSVIQCLSHTNELTRHLRNKIDIRTTTKDQRIVSEFAKLIKEMWTPTTRSVTPSELKSAFSSKHRMYSGCAQQDAQEFLRFFLDSLHCALNVGTTGEKLEIDDNLSNNKKADLTWEWYSKVENSIIKDLFVGQLKSSLKCTVCGNTSVTFDPFWDLSLPLPSPSSSRCKLETCLDLFIKEEVLDGDEMPTCSRCKTRRKCTKSFAIQRFPKYLVIHLKRFSETRWSKLSNTVEFPTNERELNMAPYAANSSASATYSLYGISNHMGSTAGGHYVALCKHPITRKWHEFNDNNVTPINENSLVSSSAYLLFYERT